MGKNMHINNIIKEIVLQQLQKITHTSYFSAPRLPIFMVFSRSTLQKRKNAT